jgi:hypothetical protein
MKNILKILLTLTIGLCCLNVHAQTSKTDKKAAEIAWIKSLVEKQRFVFLANYAMPMRGGGISLNYSYDLTIKKDTIIAFLPFYGQAFKANYGSIDNGINFTSTKFTYKVSKRKNNWDIVIVPLDKNSQTDALGVNSMRLNISPDGYASLQVTNTNRDPISFNGHIDEIPKPSK